MKVNVQHEFTGSMRFRLTFRFGRDRRGCEYVRAEEWSRQVAVEALDLLQHCYGINRRNVRFVHR